MTPITYSYGRILNDLIYEISYHDSAFMSSFPAGVTILERVGYTWNRKTKWSECFLEGTKDKAISKAYGYIKRIKDDLEEDEEE